MALLTLVISCHPKLLNVFPTGRACFRWLWSSSGCKQQIISMKLILPSIHPSYWSGWPHGCWGNQGRAPPGPGPDRSSPGSWLRPAGSPPWSPPPAWSERCCPPSGEETSQHAVETSSQILHKRTSASTDEADVADCASDLGRGDDRLHQEVDEGLIVHGRQDPVLHQTHLQTQRSQLPANDREKCRRMIDMTFFIFAFPCWL